MLNLMAVGQPCQSRFVSQNENVTEQIANRFLQNTPEYGAI